MALTEFGLAKLKEFEALHPDAVRNASMLAGREPVEAYWDAHGKIWTIGYGHTPAQKGQKITLAEADALLASDLEWAEAAVDTGVTVPLTPHQRDALVIFVYNVGAAAFKKSTMLRKLNAGDYASVPKELGRWVHAKGEKVEGLVNRRAAEAGIWAKGSFVHSREVTAAPPPPERPMIKPEVLTTAATAAGGVIATMSGATGPLSWALAGVVAIGGAAAVLLIVRRYWREAAA